MYFGLFDQKTRIKNFNMYQIPVCQKDTSAAHIHT